MDLGLGGPILASWRHSMMELRIMKWRELPKRHPPRDQGQSTGPFYVKIKIPQIASRYSLGFHRRFSPKLSIGSNF